MTPQELKNSILQLAIQGKLVEQRPEEGTAEELYQQIQAEKWRLIKEGKIKKEKPLPEIAEDEVPFEIPENWKWARWGELSTTIQYGYNAPAQTSGRIKMVRISDIQDGNVQWDTVPFCNIDEEEIPIYLLQTNDILFARTGGTVGKSFLVKNVPEESIYAGYLIRTRYSESLCPEYMKMFMESQLYWTQLKNGTIATAQPNCNGKTLAKMLLPLPPLTEQKRIVAKIEELLPYIDRYKQAWNRLEAFNKRFPSDMQKSLLQMAIQGKLVEQRPEEGTAEELYQQIQTEKRRLVKEGKIKKEKPLPEIAEDEVPFEIPESWKWVRLNGISLMIGDIDHKMPPTVEAGGVPYISPLNFTKDGGIDYSGAKHVSFDDFIQLGRKCTPSLNDIIFPRYGTIGVIRLVDTDKPFLVSYSCCTVKNLSKNLMSYKYIFYVLQSHMIQDEINRYINKTTQPNVGLQSIKNFLFPLPPLAEQKRIVAKLEELLPLCERLK